MVNFYLRAWSWSDSAENCRKPLPLITQAVQLGIEALIDGMAALLQQHLADFSAASPGGQPIGIHVDAFGAGVALGCVGRTGPIQLRTTA